jgi:hypothetical protein
MKESELIKESVFFIVNKVSGAIMVNRVFDEKEDAEQYLRQSDILKKIVQIRECEIKVKK